MSHVKNLQNFDKVIAVCTGLGGNYNPGNQNLQVNAMTTLLNSALQINDEVKEAQNAYDMATNNRVLGFKGLRTISSGVIGMLKASGANSLTMENAIRSNRKVWGAHTAKPPAAEPKAEGDVKKHGTYGRDFATVANSFGALVLTASTEAKYSPNEAQLTVDGLKQKLAEIQGLNATVTQAEVRLSEARRKRDNVYYVSDGSLVGTATATKYYVRSVFGFNSHEHTELKRLQFTKPHA